MIEVKKQQELGFGAAAPKKKNGSKPEEGEKLMVFHYQPQVELAGVTS